MFPYHSVSTQSSRYDSPSLILPTVSRGVSVMLAVLVVRITARLSRNTTATNNAHSKQPASNMIWNKYLQDKGTYKTKHWRFFKISMAHTFTLYNVYIVRRSENRTKHEELPWQLKVSLKVLGLNNNGSNNENFCTFNFWKKTVMVEKQINNFTNFTWICLILCLLL